MKEKIRVLAITKGENSNTWHRLEYPLKKINGLELEGKELEIDLKELNEEVLKNIKSYNILIYEWDIALSIQDLGNLQAQGVKILYSISDFWEFSEDNPTYKNQFEVNYAKQRVIQHLLLADAVMTTCERMA